jgi:hypothetical protein
MRVTVWGHGRAVHRSWYAADAAKPSSILAAAEEDVVRFRRNTNVEAWDCQAYAFHRMHVRRVMRKFPHAMGSDIIRIALTAWSVAVRAISE